MSSAPQEVAIVGGGIVGIITAIGLHRRGVSVKVYEQGRNFREVGAGVGFTVNAIECMKLIEPKIVDALKLVATTDDDTEDSSDYLHYSDGFNQAEGEEVNTVFRLYTGHRGLKGCHRTHFLEQLLQLLPRDVVEFRKCLLRYDDVDGMRVTLQFADGSVANADAVIGCDGIKSRVRQLLIGDAHPASYPCYTHRKAYRTLVPMNRAVWSLGEHIAMSQRLHMGPGAHLLHFPVAGHTLMNVVAFVADSDQWPLNGELSKPARKDAVVQTFANWGPTVRTITHLLDDRMDEWAIFDTNDHPAPMYVKRRICLAGDAAHAASPHHGAGAGIGVEDALALCHLMELARSGIEQNFPVEKAVNDAFSTFDAVRRDRTRWFVGSSRSICDVYEWAHPQIGRDYDKIYEEIRWRTAEIWYFDVDRMLRQLEDQYVVAVSARER